MAKVDTSEINTEIRKHWGRNFKNGKSFHYWPMQYPDLNRGCFLFVGLNPSLREEDEEFFVLESPKSLSVRTKLKEIRDEDELARGGSNRDGPCKYTLCQKVFKQINDPIKMFKSWDYIDPFSNRCLTEDKFRKQLGIVGNQDKVSWPPRGSAAEQLDIFKELLDSLKPKAVLVANALASHILIKELRLNLKDTEKGWSHLPSKKTPIFFSSAISGGHLDVFSRRRLEDQIIRVVKNR